MNTDRFTTKEIELTSQDGRRLGFIFRPYAHGDEQGLVDCVRGEYGDSYFKRFFYDPERIRENADNGKYIYFVAENEGRIGGMVILTFFRDDGDDYIEPASNIIHPDYRGIGLAKELVYYMIPQAKALGPQALFVHAVTFHSMTQSLCRGLGMIPVGFRLGSFLASRMKNSYDISQCEKYSEGIMILPVEKQDAGIVNLPEEICGYGTKIYERLGVKHEVVTMSPDAAREKYAENIGELPEEPELDVTRDDLQETLTIKVRRSGRALAVMVKEQISSLPADSLWTAQISLNASSPVIFYEYDELRRLGFFLASMKPLCGIYERIYMQWTGEVSLNMDRYVLTPEFDELRRDIEGFKSAAKGYA